MTTSRPDLVYAALSGSIDGASVFLACSKQAATRMSRLILWHVWAGGRAGGRAVWASVWASGAGRMRPHPPRP
jgi:hypothetical protein